MAVMLSDLLRNLTFNRSAHCTQVSDQCPLGLLFNNKKYDSYKCWSCTELCESVTFLMENIFVQFDGIVYQQIVGIPMGTNCAPLIADLFLYCYEKDFMSDLRKSKRFDLIDICSTIPLDILTISSPSITLNLRNMFLIYNQLNFS